MLLPPGLASLLDFVIWLLILAIFVRVILSYFPGMSYSQVGHYLGLATDWLLIPIGRVVPPLGGIDFSPFIAILLLYALRTLIQTSDLVAALLTIVASVLLMLIILLFIRVFFGFFRMDPWHPMVQIVTRTSEPFARPFRSWLPKRSGAVDWAPIAALAVLVVVYYAVSYLGNHRPF